MRLDQIGWNFKRTLGYHGCTLGYHGCTLGYHGCTLGYHGCALGYHGCALGYHGCALGYHGCDLGYHGCDLGYHGCDKGKKSVFKFHRQRRELYLNKLLYTDKTTILVENNKCFQSKIFSPSQLSLSFSSDKLFLLIIFFQLKEEEPIYRGFIGDRKKTRR